MPLPPLPSNNTIRGWLKYTSMGVNHELCFRVPLAATNTDAQNVGFHLAQQLKAYLAPTDAFTALRIANKGSNLSFPVAFNRVDGTAAGGLPEVDDKAKFVAIAGRSANGYRCRLTVFTPLPSDNDGYRLGIGLLYNAASTSPTPLAAIDGAAVIWNAYTNVGYNAYWQRRQRKG